MSRKRVWKPLDVGGLRLYKVKRRLLWKPDNSNHVEQFIVLAKKPSHAAKLIQGIFQEADKENKYIQNITYMGYALEVLMPRSWWNDGIPSEVGQ